MEVEDSEVDLEAVADVAVVINPCNVPPDSCDVPPDSQIWRKRFLKTE